MRAVLLIAAILSAVVAHNAAAGIYRWVDAQGQLHITDRPPGDAAAEQVEVRVNTYRAPAYKPIEFTTGKKTKRELVVMYSASWCGVCKQARRYFKQRSIPFQEYDVEASKANQRRFEKLGGRGVPLILVGEQRMDGFTASRMDAMLASAGYR